MATAAGQTDNATDTNIDCNTNIGTYTDTNTDSDTDSLHISPVLTQMSNRQKKQGQGDNLLLCHPVLVRGICKHQSIQQHQSIWQ